MFDKEPARQNLVPQIFIESQPKQKINWENQDGAYILMQFQGLVLLL